MTLATKGFAKAAAVLDAAALAEVAALFRALPAERPGCRIDPRVTGAIPAVAAIGAELSAGTGRTMRPVRALLFDKRDAGNWALGWHQDRVIEVAARVEVPDYGPFTVKQGRLHVAPPIALVERMVTVRIHVDAVDQDNAPLLVAPGSHRLGFVAEAEIAAVVARCGEAMCLAEAGAVWIYATPILHRSARAAGGRRRRVLQIDWAGDALPGGLAWGIDGHDA